MKNIRVLKSGIDVTPVINQLQANPHDWNPSGNASLVEGWGFPRVEAGVLQLVMGVTRNAQEFVGDSEFSVATPYLPHHAAVLKIIQSAGFRDVARCGFLSLPVGGSVGTHVDVGTYYETRDRYHLSILGVYEYTVGGEMILVYPGTLFWFNNKLPHGTKVIGSEPRVTFVFDVEMKSD